MRARLKNTSPRAASSADDARATRTASPACNPRPRGELFSDPGASVVWAGICQLDEGAQHELLIELRERLGETSDREGPLARKVARGVAALRAAASVLGRSPSVRAYRELQNSRPDLDLPPDGSVRSWLGGDWNHALERARLDRVPDSDAQVAPLGPKLTREELLQAIWECARELDHTPGLHEYLNWARRPDVRRRPGRRSRSQGPFEREFGGWPAALIAAGLIKPGEERRGQSRPRSYTDEDILRFLATVKQRIGAFPSSNRLTSEREEMLREAERAGDPRPALPSYGVYFQRFGSWAGARAAFDKWEAKQASAAAEETEREADEGAAGAVGAAGMAGAARAEAAAGTAAGASVAASARATTEGRRQ